MKKFILSKDCPDPVIIYRYNTPYQDMSSYKTFHAAVNELCKRMNPSRQGLIEKEVYDMSYKGTSLYSHRGIIKEAKRGAQWPIDMGFVIANPVYEITVECDLDGEFLWSGTVNTYTPEERDASLKRLLEGSDKLYGSSGTAMVRTLDKELHVRDVQRFTTFRNSPHYFRNFF